MTARFGIKVDDDNGHHVHFRLFAATGGEHLGGCGQLTMRSAEFAAFQRLLAPALTERPDPAGPPCGLCRQVGHGQDEHPLPKGHPQYDAFYDASDDELAEILSTARRPGRD